MKLFQHILITSKQAMRGAHKNDPLKMAEDQDYVSEEYGGIEENVNQ